MMKDWSELTSTVCWTRMQAEAGQKIEGIIARKEIERRAGEGLFFWGIGNAPSRAIRSLAAAGENIDVVFSLMKSRPKKEDAAPESILVWNSYFDAAGKEQPLPPHVLITSRMHVSMACKRAHYALMCSSDAMLCLGNQGAFDHAAYRNVGEAGGPIGNSQVTALVVRTRSESEAAAYAINLRAKLVSSYWVKLGQPRALSDARRRALMALPASPKDISDWEWVNIVCKFRETRRTYPRLLF